MSKNSLEDSPLSHLHDRARLDTLGMLDLMDTSRETELDRVVQIARDATEADTALLSLVDGERQFFKAKSTQHPEIERCSETPLSHSFCKYVVGSQEPLVIEDSREHALVQDNPAVEELDVIAYMGQPITLSTGQTMGSLCVIEETPREWTEHETRVIKMLAQMTSEQLDQRRAHILRTRRAMLEAEFISQNKLKFDSVEMVGRFAAGIAHDFKSVLAVIQSTTQILMSETEQDSARHEDLDFILEAVARGLELSESILGAVQTEPHDLEEFDLTDHIRALQPSLESAAGPNIDVRLQITDAELPMRASKELIGRIVENLVSNSAEAVRSGASSDVIVTIDRRDHAQIRKYASISVTDTGAGMDSEMLANAFSSYFEGSGRSKTTGLSQVLQVVESLGGTIEVQSKPDDGTTIEVLLPCRIDIKAPSSD